MIPTRWLNPRCRSADHLAFDCGGILTRSAVEPTAHNRQHASVHSRPLVVRLSSAFVFGFQCRAIELSGLQRRQNPVGAIRLHNTMAANRNSCSPQNGPPLFKLTPPSRPPRWIGSPLFTTMQRPGEQSSLLVMHRGDDGRYRDFTISCRASRSAALKKLVPGQEQAAT
jgi:hypothetical protein